MSPLNGSERMASKAAMTSRWSLAGSFLARAFRARSAILSCQFIGELFQGYESPSLDLGTAATDGRQLGLGGSDCGIAAVEIVTPRLPEQLRTGAVFLFFDFLDLLSHSRRQADR